MTAALADELFARILEHVPNCRYGCIACEAVPGLVAELQRLRGENEQLADFDDADRRRSTLQAERDRAVTRWHEEHKRAERLADTRDYALTLLRRFVSDAPCSPDRDGYCRSHSLSPAPCRNAEARRLLGLDAADADTNPDVCPDCYGRGDDFEGGACSRCHGTGGAA